MRRITAIPSKKIAFKNVPVSALFFSKRTLYQKISSREANIYDEQKSIYFEPEKIIRFLAKQHESVAIEIYAANKIAESECDYNINDTVDIVKKSVLGKIVSVNRRSCCIQYKENGAVVFNDFDFKEIKKIQ
jgi:hypothetical protein